MKRAGLFIGHALRRAEERAAGSYQEAAFLLAALRRLSRSLISLLTRSSANICSEGDGQLPAPVRVLGAGARNVNRRRHLQPVFRLQAQQGAVAVGNITLHPRLRIPVMLISEALWPARLGRQPYLCSASSSPCFASSRSWYSPRSTTLIRIEAQRFT